MEKKTNQLWTVCWPTRRWRESPPSWYSPWYSLHSKHRHWQHGAMYGIDYYSETEKTKDTNLTEFQILLPAILDQRFAECSSCFSIHHVWNTEGEKLNKMPIKLAKTRPIGKRITWTFPRRGESHLLSSLPNLVFESILYSKLLKILNFKNSKLSRTWSFIGSNEYVFPRVFFGHWFYIIHAKKEENL